MNKNRKKLNTENENETKPKLNATNLKVKFSFFYLFSDGILKIEFVLHLFVFGFLELKLVYLPN